MAKSKRKKDGKNHALAAPKPRTEKLAQRAGKLAAQAERIARPLARTLGLPLLPALTRHRATPPQTRLRG